MALESQQLAPDGCPDEKVLVGLVSREALLVEPAPPPGSRWRPVLVVGMALGLVVAGADITVWRTREPASAVSLESEALPLTLALGARYDIPVPGLQRVAVGTPGTVEARVVGTETLRLEPLAPGTTPLRVWTRDGGHRVYTVSVPPR
jgi:hypothetical protein